MTFFLCNKCFLSSENFQGLFLQPIQPSWLSFSGMLHVGFNARQLGLVSHVGVANKIEGYQSQTRIIL